MDPRVITAAVRAAQAGICKPVVLGTPDKAARYFLRNGSLPALASGSRVKDKIANG